MMLMKSLVLPIAIFLLVAGAFASSTRYTKQLLLHRRGWVDTIQRNVLHANPAGALGDPRPPIPPIESTPSLSVHRPDVVYQGSQTAGAPRPRAFSSAFTNTARAHSHPQGQDNQLAQGRPNPPETQLSPRQRASSASRKGSELSEDRYNPNAGYDEHGHFSGAIGCTRFNFETEPISRSYKQEHQYKEIGDHWLLKTQIRENPRKVEWTIHSLKNRFLVQKYDEEKRELLTLVPTFKMRDQLSRESCQRWARRDFEFAIHFAWYRTISQYKEKWTGGIKERRNLLKQHLRGELQFIQTRVAELKDDFSKRRKYNPPLTPTDRRALNAEIGFWKQEVQSREAKLGEIDKKDADDRARPFYDRYFFKGAAGTAAVAGGLAATAAGTGSFMSGINASKNGTRPTAPSKDKASRDANMPTSGPPT